MKKSMIIAALASLLIATSSYAIDVSVRVGNATISTKGFSYHFGKPYYIDRVRYVHGGYRGHYKPRHYRQRHYRSKHGYYNGRRYHQPKRYYHKPKGAIYYRSNGHKRYHGNRFYKGKSIRYLPNGTIIKKRRYYRY